MIIVMAAVVPIASGALAEMYKWVDSRGDTHFSETPPPGHVSPKIPTVRRDAQKEYLEFMATYDRKWKTASPAERVALDRERKRLTQEASASLKERSQYAASGMLSGNHQEYETLGSYELRQARRAMLEAQREARETWEAKREEELERKSAEHKRLEDAYLKTLSRTSNEDQSQSLRIEQRERHQKP